MNGVLTNVNVLKESAKANRDFGDLDNAIDDLKQAIAQLKEGYNSAEEGDYKDDLRQELADCYGMLGGIYRRKASANKEDSSADLKDALEMYQEGLIYEQEDSYNLSNSVVLPIIINPINLEVQTPKIHSSLIELEKQVIGKRRDQWWAWADLGLMKLLIGDKKGALEAYSQFKQKGARKQDYESTISVLSDLHKPLQQAELPEVKSCAKSVGEAIQFLQDEQLVKERF